MKSGGQKEIIMRHTRGRVVVLLALSIIAVAMKNTQAQVFPLEPNVAVATMQPRTTPVGARFVLGTYDVRNPVCDAPPFPACCQEGCVPNWLAPIYNNEMPNPTNDPADEWTEANIGLVFGIALDNDGNPNIYLTSTTVFGGSGTGTITKIGGTTGAISIFATLHNTGPGLGNIAFDHRNRQFYVSNHEDGKIYRLNFAGDEVGTFDPFGPDNGADGFCPLDERIWGLQVNQVDGRLYFGTWSEDNGRPGGPANRVYSVDLNAATGAFVGTEVLEVTVPNIAGLSYTQPISDISFSVAGKMLIAERGMSLDSSTTPHNARILQYVGGHLAWAPGAGFQVGRFGCPGNSTNSAGGIDHTDCVEADACNPGPLVMATADVLDCCSSPNNIYGISIMPDTGGNILNSWAVDMDGDTIGQDKSSLGDVEVVRTCISPPTVPTVSTWGIAMMGLLLLVGAKVYFSRRRAAQQA